jgi:hypothetical protein
VSETRALLSDPQTSRLDEEHLKGPGRPRSVLFEERKAMWRSRFLTELPLWASVLMLFALAVLF